MYSAAAPAKGDPVNVCEGAEVTVAVVEAGAAGAAGAGAVEGLWLCLGLRRRRGDGGGRGGCWMGSVGVHFRGVCALVPIDFGLAMLKKRNFSWWML
ncbi:MAG: hypothetical protein CL912_27485 [Deltaproteobacteria bacterium]|nr:hypothetical protein [Deltaproteobacteria bacterium]